MMFCSRLFSWYRFHCIHHHILGVNIPSIFSSTSPSFRPRAGDLVTMMLTINRRHPMCISVQWVCVIEARQRRMVGVNVWAIISFDWLWVALSAGSIPTTFLGPSGGVGRVFLYLCVICHDLCVTVFFPRLIFLAADIFSLTISNLDLHYWIQNHSRASGWLVLETGVQPCNLSFKHRKLLPNLKCNSWPLDKGWLNASSLPCNKQTAPSNNSVMKIKRVP